jgi:hypothetical protein
LPLRSSLVGALSLMGTSHSAQHLHALHTHSSAADLLHLFSGDIVQPDVQACHPPPPMSWG